MARLTKNKLKQLNNRSEKNKDFAFQGNAASDNSSSTMPPNFKMTIKKEFNYYKEVVVKKRYNKKNRVKSIEELDQEETERDIINACKDTKLISWEYIDDLNSRVKELKQPTVSNVFGWKEKDPVSGKEEDCVWKYFKNEKVEKYNSLDYVRIIFMRKYLKFVDYMTITLERI